jgi:hypothetical protein
MFFKALQLLSVRLTVASFLLLAGCTSSGRIVPVSQIDSDLNSYSVLVFTAEPHVAEDITLQLLKLERLVINNVQKLNYFSEIQLGEEDPHGQGALIVRALVIKIRKVSESARFWGGIFAGRASIKADVEFVDAETGATLGTYTVVGKSGGVGYSGGTDDALEEAADQIAKIIKEHYSG